MNGFHEIRGDILTFVQNVKVLIGINQGKKPMNNKMNFIKELGNLVSVFSATKL